MTMKVLVVEDNDDIRAIVVEVLRMDPEITLFEAVNGSDAVDLAGRERPQVVVTDIMMPEMDGLEATKRIKLAWPETKVIVVTAFTQSAYRAAASESGADAFVDKVDVGSAAPANPRTPRSITEFDSIRHRRCEVGQQSARNPFHLVSNANMFSFLNHDVNLISPLKDRPAPRHNVFTLQHFRHGSHLALRWGVERNRITDERVED